MLHAHWRLRPATATMHSHRHTAPQTHTDKAPPPKKRARALVHDKHPSTPLPAPESPGYNSTPQRSRHPHTYLPDALVPEEKFMLTGAKIDKSTPHLLHINRASGNSPEGSSLVTQHQSTDTTDFIKLQTLASIPSLLTISGTILLPFLGSFHLSLTLLVRYRSPVHI